MVFRCLEKIETHKKEVSTQGKKAGSLGSNTVYHLEVA